MQRTSPSSSHVIAPGASLKKKKLPPFVTKLYEMVEDPSTDHIISWGSLPTQDSFVVHRVEDFTTDILPFFFKHSNFCSFIRQVNTYGFTKTSPETWEFQNPFFARGRPELLERIERRTSVKRAGKEEHGEEDQHRLQKLSKTAEQVEQLTRENRKLAEELGKAQQESVMNEQLVKQFLLELKASKQRQREMQEREEKLLGMIREMVGNTATSSSVQAAASGIQQVHHPQQPLQLSAPRIQMPAASSVDHRHIPVSVLDLAAEMDEFDLDAYMLKLGLSAADQQQHQQQQQQQHHQHHQHQQPPASPQLSYNHPPSPFQVPQYATPPSTPPQTASSAPTPFQLPPSTPPQSPFQSGAWSAAPASPSYFFGPDNSFKFGESYLSGAVGEVGWPGYSALAPFVKQEPDTHADAYDKTTCEEFLERCLDNTAATFSSSVPTTSSPESGLSSASTPASSPFPGHEFNHHHQLHAAGTYGDDAHLERALWGKPGEASAGPE